MKTPAVFEMVKKAAGWVKGSINIDIGGGKYDTLTRALEGEGVISYIYEPYGRTSNENAYILAQLQSGNMRGDTATCSNVLNVIKEADVRANVIHQLSKAIKPDGTAYITIYEGDGKGVGKKSKDDCWQNNRKAETYADEVRRYFGDVTMKGKLIVAKEPLEQDMPAQWRRGGDSDAVVNFSVAGKPHQDDVGKSHEYPKGSVIYIGGREVDLSRCHALGSNGQRLGKDTFLLTPSGNPNWYEFPRDEHTLAMLKKKGIVPKPVRLRVGGGRINEPVAVMDYSIYSSITMFSWI